MNKQMLSFLAFAICFTGCGGGGNVGGPPPPPPPQINVTVAPTSVGATAGQTQKVVFTATVTGTTNTAVTWSVAGVTGGNATTGTIDASGNYTAPATVPNPNQVTVTATSQAAPTKSASATVTISAPQLPTLSVNPPTASVNIGGTQNFTLTATNATILTGTSTLFGNIPITGNNASYAVPVMNTVPSSWSDTATFTASNGSGQNAQVPVPITLRLPVPTITAVNPQTQGMLFLFGSANFGGLEIDGTGFINDGGASADVAPDPDIITSGQIVSWSSLTLSITIGPKLGIGNPVHPAPWNPGFYNFTFTNTSSHGGGTSAGSNFGFVGTYDQLAFNASDAFLLDPNTGTVKKFKVSDRSSDGQFTTVGIGPGAAIAVDDMTGLVVVSGTNTVVAYDASGSVKATVSATGTVMGVTAGGGWVCFTQFGSPTQGLPNMIGCADIHNFATIPNPTPTIQSVFGTPENFPWEMQLTSLGGKTTLVALCVESNMLAMVPVSSFGNTPIPWKAASIPGFTTAGQLGTHPGQGGWQLRVFNSGPSQGKAVALSQFDRSVVSVDLTQTTLTASPAISLTGLPFRMDKREADGSLAVALADVPNGHTRSVKVTLSGTVSSSVDATPFLATGYRFDPNGQLWGGNRGIVQAATNP